MSNIRENNLKSFNPAALKLAIKKAGMTQQELAYALGRDRTYVTYLLKEEKVLNSTYDLILRILNCTDEDLNPELAAPSYSAPAMAACNPEDLEGLRKTVSSIFSDVKALKVQLNEVKKWMELIGGVISNIEKMNNTQKI